MAKDESITDKVEKLFHRKHKNWRQLYSSHNKAVKAAYANTKDDTTNLKPEEIYDEVAKFMHTYDFNIGEATKWDGLKSYQKKIYSGKARGLLENLAEERKMPLEDLIEELRSKGLTQLFEVYSSTKVNQSEGHYRKSIMNEHVKKEDADKWYDYIVDKKPLLKDKKKHHILSNIESYVSNVMNEYHHSTKSEKQKKE